MTMTGASSGWSRVQPPLFLWGAVVLSPVVMGMGGEGPPSRVALAMIGLCLGLGFFELSPRQGRLPSILVALLYVLLAASLSGPPPGLIDVVFAAATLVSGALCASICSGVARIERLSSAAHILTPFAAASFLFCIEMGPQLSKLSLIWDSVLRNAACLGAVAALVHLQMLSVLRGSESASGQRIWMVETLSLFVGFGLVLLLAALAEGWEEAIGFAAALLLAAAALHREIGPRVVAVTAVLYASANAAPLADFTLQQMGAFLGLIFAAMLPLRGIGRTTFLASEEPLWFTAMQPAADAWMVTFDLGRDQVLLGPGAEAHFGPKRRFGVWLEQLSAEESSRLLGLLHGCDPAPVTVTLRGAGSRAVPTPYAVHLLERKGSRSRVVLRRLAAEAVMTERVASLQGEVDRMRLREERLLALASHELRTPVATLSMLAEEVDAGEPWEEIGPDVHAAIGQILAVLDDLRAGGKTEGALARAGEISLPQVTQWLREEFGGLAQTLGVTLQLELPEGDGPQYRCEAGRLLLVLEKLLRHALSLPDLRRLRIALVAMPLGGDRQTLVWTVLPMGDVPLPMPDATLFEPFATGPEAGLGARLQGAGLYTAEKAAIAMGGALKLQRDPAGFLFVFTHPVRRLSDHHSAGRP